MSHCCGYLARLHYLRTKKAEIATQCAWKGKITRRELRKLQMAAKETGALQAAKILLEKQVKELTWHLQLEKRMRACLEEARTQENTRLKSALEEIQLQFDKSKAMLVKERETTMLTYLYFMHCELGKGNTIASMILYSVHFMHISCGFLHTNF